MSTNFALQLGKVQKLFFIISVDVSQQSEQTNKLRWLIYIFVRNAELTESRCAQIQLQQ